MRISDWSSDVCSSDLRIKEDLASILQPVDQREAKQPVRDACREAHRLSKLVVHMHVKKVAGNAGEIHDMRLGNHDSWRERFTSDPNIPQSKPRTHAHGRA